MIEITKEIIRDAQSYLPLLVKCKICDDCLNQLVKKSTYREKDQEIPVPPRAFPRDVAIRRLKMGVLAALYLKTWKPEDDNIFMNADDYDVYCGSFVVNQIRRMERDKAFGDKAYNLLDDYRDFCRMVDEAVRNYLFMINDDCARNYQMSSAMADPEAIKSALESIRGMAQEAEQGAKPDE